MRVLALDQCAYSDNYLIDVTREWKLERNRLSMRPRSMSGSGQSQPNWAARAMSGLPPIATVLRTSQVVRFVPDSEVANPIRQLYPVHVTTRKSLGLMMRKLSVTESQRFAQFRGTFSRRKPSVASANWAQVA